MKRSLICLLLAATFHYTKAQTASDAPDPVRPRFNADLELSVPGGQYGSQFGIGFGGALGLDVPVTRSFYATGAAGVMSFYRGGKPDPVDTRSYVPLKLGGKYYFNSMLYGQMELGTALGIQQGAGTAFIMTPGVGMSYHITEKAAINAGVRFETWNREGGNINQLTFKLGYQF